MTFTTIRAAALCLFALTGPALAGDDDCAQVHSKLTFCGGEQVWSPMEAGKTEGVAMFRNSGESFGKVIVEKVTPGQVSREQIENAILTDLVIKQGDEDGRFTVDSLDGGKVDGEIVGNLSYSIPGRTKPLNLLHSYLVRGDLLIQFITITANGIGDGNARNLHKDFLGSFRITADAPLL
ncbi:MAG: hypothetical protein CMH12_04485 [Maritimibacter sp.]|nr:hypothetical protein [Maritimibacter sp.]|tara:strand:+ start:363 stop:902 length:540 start_codon:yes stop_codon:yes gene_type:complete